MIRKEQQPANKLFLVCIIVLLFGHLFDVIFLLDLHNSSLLKPLYDFYFSIDPAYEKAVYTHAILINSVFFMLPVCLLVLFGYFKNNSIFYICSLIYFGSLVTAFIIWVWTSYYSDLPITNWYWAAPLSMPLVLASAILAVNGYKKIEASH